MKPWLVLALCLVAVEARAAPLALSVEQCPAVTTRALFEALALELAGERVALVDDAPNRIAVRCLEGTARVDLTFDLRGSRQVETLDLSDVSPDQRLRALALTLAERYRAWVLEAPPPTEPRPDPPPPTEPLEPEAAPRPTRLSAGLALTTWPASFFLLGPRVALSTRLGASPLALHVALDAGFTTTAVASGDVSTWSVGGALGLDLVGGSPAIAWAVGPRAVVSALGFDGATNRVDRSGASGVAPIIALGVGADLHLFVSPDWFIAFGVDAGITLLGARATAPEGTLLDATNTRLGVSLGIGWAPAP